MKRMWLYLFVVLLVFTACREKATGKNGVTYSNALQYNNYILDKQTAIRALVNRLLQEKDTSITKAEQTLQSAIAATDKSIQDISGMPDWKGNTALRDSTVLLFNFYKKTLSEDFRHLMILQEDATVTPMEAADYEQVSKRIRQQQHLLDSGLKATQKQFAIDNGFLSESGNDH